MRDKENKGNQFLQILLPILICLFAIGYGGFVTVQNGLNPSSNLRITGDIATVYLLFLITTPVFLILALIIVFIIFTYKGMRSLKGLFPKFHATNLHVNSLISSACSVITKPFIEIESNFSIFSNQKSEKSQNAEEK